AAEHWLARVRGDTRLGWDVEASSFQRGLLRPDRRAALVSAHITSNYVQDEGRFLELGLGLLTYQDPSAVWGPSAELSWESFPRRPWSVAARLQGGEAKGRGYYAASVSAGATWRWLGVSAGWRALLAPRGTAAGPTFSLRAWF
ncbi:MAG: hypothetical protein KGL53_07475, partial [Elusimicrobia bacterium]|nr:hypothetical protein [Elusimicrobiota bacterium]